MTRLYHHRRNAPSFVAFRPVFAHLRNNCAGASAAEFALVLPVLLTMFFAVIKFGIVFNNNVEIISGARASARVFATSRGSATPWTDGQAAFQSSTPNAATATLAVQVNGAPCSSDGACQTLLTGASGQPISVSASLPCDLSIMGFDFAPGCQLQTHTVERVE
jgi:Flp pilus assembly protein TadG